MRILILSDIHGDYLSFKKIIDNENFDKLVILGDLFSYDYNYENYINSDIIKLLLQYKDKLILIKGNCDIYIDYNKLGLRGFDIITLPLNNNLVTFTHGDKYCKGFLPEYHGNIFISGHTHRPILNKESNIIYCNPGSVGKPRGNSNKGYLIFDNNKLVLMDINKNIISELMVKKNIQN